MLPTLARNWTANLPRAASTMGATQGGNVLAHHLSTAVCPVWPPAGLLVFIGSLGFFITPALLGGPRDTMLGQLIIQQIHGASRIGPSPARSP